MYVPLSIFTRTYFSYLSYSPVIHFRQAAPTTSTTTFFTQHLLNSRRLAIPNAARLIRKRLRARNLLERNIRVVSALEPVEAPVAARLELLGEAVALRARRNPAILLSPAVWRRAPLVGARVEHADAAAGHREIEVVLAQIAARVGGLHDQLLALYGARGERQPRLL